MNPSSLINKEYDWKLLAEPYDVKVCEKCGLVKLETLSNVHYFVQFTDPYVKCYHSSAGVEKKENASSE